VTVQRTNSDRIIGTPCSAVGAGAHEPRATLDSQMGADLFDGDRRWVGMLGECGLAIALRSISAKFAWHNEHREAALEEDFTVWGKSVQVKTRMKHGTLTEDWQMLVPAQHSATVQELAFCAVDRAETNEPRVVVVGGMDAARFFDRATHWKKGEQWPGGQEIRNDCYGLDAAKIPNVATWCARLALTP
jgi:hypothetical protein